MITTPIQWNKGNTPPELGWYLCAVNLDKDHPDYVITLMLWYNPSSYGQWYFGCGVGGAEGIDYGRSQNLTGEWNEQHAVVKAWDKVPKCNLNDFPDHQSPTT